METTNKESQHQQELTTKDRADQIVDMLIKQAHERLQSPDPLSASEMKVCLDICKTYSSGIMADPNLDLLKDLPFENDGT
jgi:hypothetical protein|tara:strand:- start:471 stop:710 length:240 start_codon:yes stop_codon:yes gene_type:complete